MMKRLLALITLIVVLSGCAVLTGVRKYFCNLPINSLVSQLQTNVQDINSNYNTYVAMLVGGDQTVRPWVVAADGFLAQASPLLVGLQAGVCYSAEMISNALATYQAAKAVQPK